MNEYEFRISITATNEDEALSLLHEGDTSKWDEATLNIIFDESGEMLWENNGFS